MASYGQTPPPLHTTIKSRQTPLALTEQPNHSLKPEPQHRTPHTLTPKPSLGERATAVTHRGLEVGGWAFVFCRYRATALTHADAMRQTLFGSYPGRPAPESSKGGEEEEWEEEEEED